MKLIIFLLISFNVSQALAWKGCKLNDFGQNICVDERALYKIPSTRTVAVVEILEHSREFTLIKMRGNEYRVNINLLIGNTNCNIPNSYCRGTKVAAKRNCGLSLPEGDIKIIESFENNMTLIEIGRRNHRLIINSCLQIIQ